MAVRNFESSIDGVSLPEVFSDIYRCDKVWHLFE